MRCLTWQRWYHGNFDIAIIVLSLLDKGHEIVPWQILPSNKWPSKLVTWPEHQFWLQLYTHIISVVILFNSSYLLSFVICKITIPPIIFNSVCFFYNSKGVAEMDLYVVPLSTVNTPALVSGKSTPRLLPLLFVLLAQVGGKHKKTLPSRLIHPKQVVRIFTSQKKIARFVIVCWFYALFRIWGYVERGMT